MYSYIYNTGIHTYTFVHAPLTGKHTFLSNTP